VTYIARIASHKAATRACQICSAVMRRGRCCLLALSSAQNGLGSNRREWRTRRPTAPGVPLGTGPGDVIWTSVSGLPALHMEISDPGERGSHCRAGLFLLGDVATTAGALSSAGHVCFVAKSWQKTRQKTGSESLRNHPRAEEHCAGLAAQSLQLRCPSPSIGLPLGCSTIRKDQCGIEKILEAKKEEGLTGRPRCCAGRRLVR